MVGTGTSGTSTILLIIIEQKCYMRLRIYEFHINMQLESILLDKLDST